MDRPQEEPGPDTSHELDMETVFISETHNSEMQALEVQSLLEAQGIPTVVVSVSQFPSCPYEVRVPRARLEEARAVIAAAEEAGPEAAEQQYETAEIGDTPAATAD